MPFERPLLTDLVDRIEADVSSRLGLGPLLEQGPAKVLARVEAGAAHLLHGHLDFVARQVIADSAEAEFLDRWASLWGITRKAATFSTGTALFTGNVGATVPAGTLVQAPDGREYATDVSTDLVPAVTDGEASIALTAKVAGLAGDAPTATILTLVSPVAGINSTATVETSGLSGGTDEESDEDLLARLLVFLRTRPQGGADADYVAWALEVAGVTRAFALPLHFGVGTVGVVFLRDDDSSPIPDAAEVAAVQANIDAKKPVTAAATVFAPAELTTTVQVAITPNTVEVRDAITANVEDLFQTHAAPGTPFLISRLREAISTADGEQDSQLIFPTANLLPAAAQIPILAPTIIFSTL